MNRIPVCDLPQGFVSTTTPVEGTNLHYVHGGDGPVVVLLHGFPQDWHEFLAIMPRLARSFTVLSLDLRGIGQSTVTSGEFDAATMARDVYQLVSNLDLKDVYVVGHDIGGIVAYAFVRKYPETMRGAMILDVPIPGIDGWQQAMSDPNAWHVRFMQVPDFAETVVAGRQAEFFSYFFKFSTFTTRDIDHYLKAYATTAQLNAAFEMYRAFPSNERFNAEHHGCNEVPILYAAGEKSPFASLASQIANGLRSAGCSRVQTALVVGAVHYVVQDQPEAIAELIEGNAGPIRRK